MWLDNFPVMEGLGQFSDYVERPLFVDVGGGFGHQDQAFMHKFPELKGRIVVQDTSVTVAEAKPIEGIEFLEHDFFKLQPESCKFAKIYYTL